MATAKELYHLMVEGEWADHTLTEVIGKVEYMYPELRPSDDELEVEFNRLVMGEEK